MWLYLKLSNMTKPKGEPDKGTVTTEGVWTCELWTQPENDPWPTTVRSRALPTPIYAPVRHIWTTLSLFNTKFCLYIHYCLKKSYVRRIYLPQVCVRETLFCVESNKCVAKGRWFTLDTPVSATHSSLAVMVWVKYSPVWRLNQHWCVLFVLVKAVLQVAKIPTEVSQRCLSPSGCTVVIHWLTRLP